MIHAAIGGKIAKHTQDPKVTGSANRVYLIVEYKRQTKTSPPEYVGIVIPTSKFEDIKYMIEKEYTVNFSISGFCLVTEAMWTFDGRILAAMWSQFTL